MFILTCFSRYVSDLWNTTTSNPVTISENFSLREFTASLQHLAGKIPDSICPEHIIHAGAALKSWLREFLSFLLAPTQNFQDLEKSTCSCDLKANATRREPKELSTDIFALCPLQDP